MSNNDKGLSHGFRRAPLILDTQVALGWGVVVVLIVMLLVVYLVQGSQQVESGYHMQRMTWELNALQETNIKLERLIAAGQSVEDLQQRAEQLGFVKAGPDDIEYLRVENYPGDSGEAMVGVAESETERDDTLSQWLRGSVRGFSGWRSGVAGGEP